MSRIIKMGDVMRALKNVAGATMLTPGQCWELAQALSKEDAFEPVPVITDHSVERQDVLPCDVRLAPATTIRKGCKVETLMRCIELRKGQLPEFTAFKSSAPHEPAELQATIAQMAEEVKRIKTISDNYSALLMDANAEIERLKSESFEELYNAVIDERDALAERLKGGQGDPAPEVIANWSDWSMVSVRADGAVRTYVECGKPERPASVSVVLPERMPMPHSSDYIGCPHTYAAEVGKTRAHNACLDKIKELNQ